MNAIDLTDFINSPQYLDVSTLIKLKELVQKYPYCQTGQLLFAKNLYNNGSTYYAKYLNIAASYAGSRKKLYALINNLSKEVKNSDLSLPVKDQVKEPEIIKPLTDSNLKDIPKPIEITTNQNKPIIEAVKPIKEVEIKKPEITPVAKSDADKKAEFQRQLKIRLAEIAQESKKEEKTINSSINDNEKSNKNELIDKFIKEEPRLIPKNQETVNNEDLSMTSSLDDSEIISETLAQIYEKQGNYAKAILTYEKLCLKFPEKNTYFAAQIENIKKSNQ